MMRQGLRFLAAAAAMVFITTATPSAAARQPEGQEFNACSQCHEGASDGWCAGLMIYTISSCCGSMNQTAWAWCVNSEWGFYVSCQTNQSFECQCDEWGNGCERLPPRMND